ncbi:MAG: hypothetical protein OXP68_03030 [Anaerolineaceae bacterium]|nr:hypothetical protein [Anaerolineaceae bacterium]MDE0328016.1 hypothetical protein [Anaerolineaceae bacterium]
MARLKPPGIVLAALLLLAGLPEEEVLMSDLPDSAAQTPQIRVVADFGVALDPPLVKKFDFMNSGIVPMRRYRRDLDLIVDLKAQTLRVDLFLGNPEINGWTNEIVSGTADDLQFDFTELDELSQMLKDRGMAGYWSWCYNPLPLQTGRGHASHPSSLLAWREIMHQVARHFSEENLRPAYHAIWNEPDLDIFYDRSVDDYNKLYKYGVEGLRAGDPDAYVGGPDLAFTDEWIDPFLDFVESNRLPLDFFAFHAIGVSPTYRINTARRKIRKRPYFERTELVFSELNPSMIYHSPQAPTVRYTQAAIILDHIAMLVDQTDITRVHWAQFMESGYDTLGVVDIDGHRRAAYNAFKLYAMMPVDRRALDVSGPLSGLASSDAHTAAVLLWNRSRSDRHVQVDLRAIPFAQGNLRVYRIDEDHASFFENSANEELTAVEVLEDVSSAGLSWSGDIPDHGVVYLEVTDGSGLSELRAVPPIGDIIRIDRYFPDRSRDNYAEFDRSTWIARLGMGSQDLADSRIGVTVEGLPASLDVSFAADGTLQQLDVNSVLGLRLDYLGEDIYSKAVLFHGSLYSSGRQAPVPWGTGRPADQVVELDDLSGIRLSPATYAPPNWSGRIIMTFMMQNTGARTRAKVVVRSHG